jgi:hypothetical protein
VGRHAAAARSQVSGSWLDTLVYVSILFENFRFGTDLVVSSKFALCGFCRSDAILETGLRAILLMRSRYV